MELENRRSLPAKFFGCLGYSILLILLLIPFGFVSGIFIVGFFSGSSLNFFSKSLMMGIPAIAGLIFLIGLDWIRHKIAIAKARRYLRAFPKTDIEAFCEAFPDYEHDFLLKFRRVVASAFQTSEEKISSNLDLGERSPLCVFNRALYKALFEVFCPPKSKRIIFDFPMNKIATVQDLLKETQQLASGAN